MDSSIVVSVNDFRSLKDPSIWSTNKKKNCVVYKKVSFKMILTKIPSAHDTVVPPWNSHFRERR